MLFSKNILILLCGALLVTGCQTINSRIGRDSMNYADARELPALKFPPDALPVSKRYEIPAIANENAPIIDNLLPPDYNS